MRPLRGLLACLVTLSLLTVVLTLRRKSTDHNGATATRNSSRRLRALFSFNTPESLFPPSAIISLTDDNSTFFLSRPAAYGSSLPADGLSGQLWIGSGFGEDLAGQAGSSINAGGELGCSDIPGWPYSRDVEDPGNRGSKRLGTNSGYGTSKEATKRPVNEADSGTILKSNDNTVRPPSDNDGTDAHLHWPLKGSPLLRGATTPQKFQEDRKGQDKEHADIQSIQESAEISGKVVLLSRGGCGFLEKTKWVQRRGGVALVVGDNLRGASLITMYANGDTSNVTIPSVFTSHMSAQLLSSLVGPGGFLNGRPPPSGINPGRPHSPIKKGPFRSTKGKEKEAPVKSDATKPWNAQSRSANDSWIRRFFGMSSQADEGAREAKRRTSNNEGANRARISEINGDTQPKDISMTRARAGKLQDVKGGSNVVKDSHGSGDGFVIGVHDWRDPDLVALQREERQATVAGIGTVVTHSVVTATTARAVGNAQTTGLGGGNALPGSGRYSMPGKAAEGAKTTDKSDESDTEQENVRWYKKLFGSDVEQLTEEEALGLDEDSLSSSSRNIKSSSLPPLFDGPNAHEGLWVTITPTTMSSSPFFDTLLVLVVSPLVTLTVVYALLLLRARIQRRRWRAPKSVVERLPVRIYHTMSSSSSTSTSHTPSVDHSSAASPLLQPDQSSTLSRTRTRPRIADNDVSENAALTLERQREDLATRYEKKRYRGRQIECAVCLEEYVDGQSQVMSLPCGHEFHAECITPWLTTRRRTCPICKGDVVRSLAASSSREDRSESPSPGRSRQLSRTRSPERSDTPHSDTPLLRGQSDDLEQGSRARPFRNNWSLAWVRGLRFWNRSRDDALLDRDR